MSESLSPVQGLIAIDKNRMIYGLPLGIGVGGGGMRVTISLPPTLEMGSGEKMILIGSYAPGPSPPIVEHPIWYPSSGNGQRVLIVSSIPKADNGGSCRAVVIADADIAKARSGGGEYLGEVTVVPP